MPVTIGARRESDFTDPLGMLSDCHRRIERFLGVLERLASSRTGGSLSETERSALSTSLQYFREAAPKHTADEEESLFPRLRQAGGSEAGALLERIAALESDHEYAVQAHAEVDMLGSKWLTCDSLSPEDASRLDSLLRELSALYARHIAIEDGEVFPAAGRLISAQDRIEVGNEMAARRGVSVSGSFARAALNDSGTK